MNNRFRGVIKLLILLAVFGGLALLFPRSYALMELAARELRYFWWVILLLVLAIWLIWGIGKKPDKLDKTDKAGKP